MAQVCRTCKTEKPETAFSRRGAGLNPYCKACQSTKRAERRARKSSAPKIVSPVIIRRSPVSGATESAADYQPADELVATWAAVQAIAASGTVAPNMLFTGPSGSGKTEAARYLARIADLPFYKVDAPSVTDAESWFGTREVVAENGASRTVVSDSAFVEALGQRCVLLIDEGNRVSDSVRNILLPIFDDSRSVTNPLTGQTVERHPECYIIITGNVGLSFTGTYAVDPAFLTRCLTTRFDYLDASAEAAVLVARTGIDEKTAALLARLGTETRLRAKASEDFPPVSTRELLSAARLVSVGLPVSIAVEQAILSGASTDGGAESVSTSLRMIWSGIQRKA